jgi:hypothetical protein
MFAGEYVGIRAGAPILEGFELSDDVSPAELPDSLLMVGAVGRMVVGGDYPVKNITQNGSEYLGTSTGSYAEIHNQRRNKNPKVAAIPFALPSGLVNVEVSGFRKGLPYLLRNNLQLGTDSLDAVAHTSKAQIQPKEDTLYEGDETVILTLTENPSSYLVGLPKSAEVVIVDNEPKPPTVTISATDPLASERRGDTGQFTFYRTGDASRALMIKYAVAGSATNRVDYLNLSGTVTIPAHALSASVNIVPVDDRNFEGEETVILTLLESPAYQVGDPNSATVTIADNDLPVVSIKTTNASASEVGPTPGRFTISRTGKNSEPLVVYYTVSGTATNGVDYGAIGGVITIPAGSLAEVLVINPVDDQDFERSETVTVTLASNPAYTLSTSKTATVTIVDNDLPRVTVMATDAQASEPGTDKGQFTVYRSGVTTRALSVRYSLSGTATNGMDYTRLSGTVTIPAKAASATIMVLPRDDKIVEGVETVLLTIAPGNSYLVGDPSDATVSIADND